MSEYLPLSRRRARRRRTLMLRALLGGLAFVALSVSYLLGASHFGWPAPGILRSIPVLRAYLAEPPVDPLRHAIAAQGTERMYRFVPMGDHQARMSVPNLRKLMFRAGDRFDTGLETEDTPAIRAAMAGIRVDVAEGSYNQAGFRNVDLALTQTCDSSVVFLGDSFTDGPWVSDEETFVNRYGHLVRERSGARICLTNAGVTGFSAREAAWVFEHGLAHLQRLKTVFVMIAPDDIGEDALGIVRGTIPDLEQAWTTFLSSLRRIAEVGRARGAIVVLVAIPPAEQLRDGGPRTHYQDRLRQFARTEQLALIDLLAAFMAIDHEGLYWDWDRHFTPRGHGVVSTVLFESTVELLAPRVNR
jgi:lysophospholipase L1-like esterase